MGKRLTFTWLSTLVVSAVISLTITYFIVEAGRAERQRHGCDMSAFAYVFTVGVTLLMALGILPIYFNLSPKVRQHLPYSLLSFFLLPMLIVVVILFSKVWMTLAITLPYLVILALHFWFLRRSIAANRY